jgi:hypothetical protein
MLTGESVPVIKIPVDREGWVLVVSSSPVADLTSCSDFVVVTENDQPFQIGVDQRY